MTYKTVKPNPTDDKGKKAQVEEMFDQISGRYDFLNRFLSVGIDKIWRRKAIDELKSLQPKQILDVATGTGDFAIESLKLKPDFITGLDLSEGMLSVFDHKIKQKNLSQYIKTVKGDSENLPFENDTFDAVTVAFGVRNFENLAQGLSEINRVLKPGGKLVVLEFSNPTTFPIKQLYKFYFKYILPFWGRLIAKHKTAYTYLPASVQVFPEGEKFLEYLRNAGYTNERQKKLSFGICSIYTGVK